MKKEDIIKFKKHLKIKNPILGIYFLKKPPKETKHYRDTACTALARAFLKKEPVFFGFGSCRQICRGAEYFLKLSKINIGEVLEVYTKKELIFKNKNVCRKFLRSLPKLPFKFKNKNILIKPFKAGDRPHVIISLVNPSQTSRIIGLMGYDDYKVIKIYPNQPTCLSFFAPIVTGQAHLNFIDYYDRYYQGKINKKTLWPEDALLVSLIFKDFQKILSNFYNSSQGIIKPKIKPAKVDRI